MIRGRGQDDAGSTHGVPNYDGLCASASTSCPRPNGTVKLMILNKNQIGCKNVLVLRQVNLKQSFCLAKGLYIIYLDSSEQGFQTIEASMMNYCTY